MSDSQQTFNLFSPSQIGSLPLPHRVVMAPLTRSRSKQPGNVPYQLNADYYAQRADAAFILTEATQITQQGQGYAWTPGIHSADQIAGWKLVTDAVHAKGGRIFMQLWHVGRISHPSLQPGGALPVAPSAIVPPGQAFVEGDDGQGGFAEFVTPRALETDEIPGLVADYVQAAKNAKEAGFDGVEVHSANGYLLDQFLNTGTNKRTDGYGGTVENRARFLLEVVDAVAGVWTKDRVGVRLSPQGVFNGQHDDDPFALFDYVSKALNDRDLAYLHIARPEAVGDGSVAHSEPRSDDMLALIRKNYKNPLILAGGYDLAEANDHIAHGKADLVAFGRAFIANPDLPERLRRGAPLNEPDRATFYGGGAAGYTDYPVV